MSISPMKKLTLLLCGGDTDVIMRKLMYLRCVDIAKTDGDTALGLRSYQGEERVTELLGLITDIETAIKSLLKYSTRKKSMFAGRINISLDDFINSGRYDDALRTVREINNKVSDKAERDAGTSKVAEQINELLPWSAYDLPLNILGTESTSITLGSVPVSLPIERFTTDILASGGAVDLIHEDSAARYVSVIYGKDDEDNIARTLAKLGFIKAVFRDMDKTPLEMITEYRNAFAEASAKTAADEGLLKEMAEKLCDIEILHDAVSTELNTAKSKLRLASTDNCVMLSGWVPAKNEEKVAELLEKYDCAYELIDPVEGDDPPILLKNNEFAKNFEWVLGMYSYPKYGSYDPSFIMGIFYCLIFGMMFADVGYGLIMIIACFGGVKLLKPREGMKRFLLMFGYCGIACLAMGVIFGGYLSDMPQQIMKNLLGIENPPSFALLIDPLIDPVGLLIVALIMGGIHLIAGMAVKMYIIWRDGHPLDAVFDIVPWWILFAGLIMLYFKPSVGGWISIAGVAALILTQGRKQKNIFMKIFKGVGSLYGFINIFSDLVSYSRIMALGLASAVLGQVMNILGTMLGTNIIGFFFMILVFIVGHALNMAINILGSFVHTSRLQYIEFFGKFFEEGGRAFAPVLPADKYTIDSTNLINK